MLLLRSGEERKLQPSPLQTQVPSQRFVPLQAAPTGLSPQRLAGVARNCSSLGLSFSPGFSPRLVLLPRGVPEPQGCPRAAHGVMPEGEGSKHLEQVG